METETEPIFAAEHDNAAIRFHDEPKRIVVTIEQGLKSWFALTFKETWALAAALLQTVAPRLESGDQRPPIYFFPPLPTSPNHTLCPLRVQSSLQGYVRGLPTGDFLRAVLSNDLAEAIARADDVNLPALPHIVAYVVEHLPAISWGSKDAVNRWLKTKRAERDRGRTFVSDERVQSEPYGPSETQMQARIASVSEEAPSSEIVDLMGALKDSLSQRDAKKSER